MERCAEFPHVDVVALEYSLQIRKLRRGWTLKVKTTTCSGIRRCDCVRRNVLCSEFVVSFGGASNPLHQ